MPIAVRLSPQFHDRFGDEATNELVGVLNAIDSNYRKELREINELNYARFDAKVGERFDELRPEMRRRFAEARLEMDGRFLTLRAEVRSIDRLLKVLFAFGIPSVFAIIALLTRR